MPRSCSVPVRVVVRAPDFSRETAERAPLGEKRKHLARLVVGDDENRYTGVKRLDRRDDFGCGG
jgi:hypothetical protein